MLSIQNARERCESCANIPVFGGLAACGIELMRPPEGVLLGGEHGNLESQRSRSLQPMKASPVRGPPARPVSVATRHDPTRAKAGGRPGVRLVSPLDSRVMQTSTDPAPIPYEWLW